ncbi:MAG: mechanosensitive ion channel family protein [Gemmatimonadales bacterium]
MVNLLQTPAPIERFANTPFFGAGVTWGQLLATIALTLLVLWVTRRVLRQLIERALEARGVSPATAHAASTVTYYILVALGMAVVLQSTGIDLSSLTVVAGALGIGIGFGLQTVVGNFVSGLVILLERPIKVGDRIEVGSLVGTVRRIGARATTIVTNDEVAIIVPNNDFVVQRVTNWSYTGSKVRFVVPVGVSYAADPEAVRAALVAAAATHAGVLVDPKPDVIFAGFGDSALLFELRVWTASHIHVPKIFVSELNSAIFAELRGRGIEIPFPQRDLHVRSGSLVVESRPAQ